MNKAPEEDLNDLLSDLAMTMADILDHSQTPNDLRDVLHETIDELTNAIGPSPSESLRALAGLVKARDGRTRAEAESTPTSRFCANTLEENADFQALAKASGVQ